MNEPLSGTSTPLLSTHGPEDEVSRIPLVLKREAFDTEKRALADRIRLRKEIVRRLTELILILGQGKIVQRHPEAQLALRAHRAELLASCSVLPILAFLYPLRVVASGILAWQAIKNRSPLNPCFIRPGTGFLSASHTRAGSLLGLPQRQRRGPPKSHPQHMQHTRVTHPHRNLGGILQQPSLGSYRIPILVSRAAASPQHLSRPWPLYRVLSAALPLAPDTVRRPTPSYDNKSLDRGASALSASLINVLLLAYSLRLPF